MTGGTVRRLGRLSPTRLGLGREGTAYLGVSRRSIYSSRWRGYVGAVTGRQRSHHPGESWDVRPCFQIAVSSTVDAMHSPWRITGHGSS